MDKNFSIIIISYNNDYNITSILKKVNMLSDFFDIEIILIDDCSIVNQKKFIPKNINNIIFHRNKNNLGIGSTRNIGISLSSKDYLIFIDGDDDIDFIRMKDTLSSINNVADVIKIPYKVVYKNSYIANVFSDEDIVTNDFFIKKYIMNFKISVTCWSHIYKKSFLLKNNIFFDDLMISEDTLFFLKIHSKNPKIQLLNNWYYIYNRNIRNSLTKKKYNINDYKKFIKIVKALYRYEKLIYFKLYLFTFLNDKFINEENIFRGGWIIKLIFLKLKIKSKLKFLYRIIKKIH